MEWRQAVAQQLLETIDRGLMNEKTIEVFYHWHLNALKDIVSCMNDGDKSYVQIKSYLEKISIERLRKKEKIKVGFMVVMNQLWIGDELYNLMEAAPKFEPYIVTMAFYDGKNERMVREVYLKTVHFFKEKGMRVIETMNAESGAIYTWEQIGGIPDICIWLNSWTDGLKDVFQPEMYPLSTLHTYIPYGFMIAENKKNNFVYSQYNKIIHNISWKIFEESRISVEMAGKYAYVGKSNAVYTGYPKMDAFFLENKVDVWKCINEKSGVTNAKRIIYAPHHSIDADGNVCFSTFSYNFQVVLELAKKYEKETVWIFRPHPSLKFKSILAGVFEDENAWNEYLQEWNNLKNAMVVEDGECHAMFEYSDAMILDSVSFLSEYLYVNKPLLFLQREEQRFNDYGKLLLPILYQTDGKNFDEIDAFIQNIVIGEQDVMKEEREQFFEENLNYRMINGTEKSAAWNIFELLRTELY